ncbi:hypothetical protein PINS_up009126 [Pythium insidiosum]|nr:hypothetical protein PINS_up009126 [Pythium insidiosum]
MARQTQQRLEAAAAATPIAVSVELDGATHVFEGVAGQFSAVDVLRQMQERGLPKVAQALAVQLSTADSRNNSRVVDLRYPLESDCSLSFLDFSTDEGKKVFWHSSAHVLGQALEIKYQDKIRLCDGPALSEGGFFYEMFLQDQLTVSDSDFPELTSIIKRIVKQRQPFERLVVSRDTAREMFEYSEFKRQMLDKIPAHEDVTLYRCGPLIDLCRGPHVPHTGTYVSSGVAFVWNGRLSCRWSSRVARVCIDTRREAGDAQQRPIAKPPRR